MKRKNPQAYRPYKHFHDSEDIEQRFLLPSADEMDALPDIEQVELPPRRIVLWDEG